MAQFIRSFDCNNKDHVMWLKAAGQIMSRTLNGEMIDILAIVNNNPLPGKPSMENPADWASIHFQLAMKYTMAVLSCDAFVPTTKNDVLV
jgi:hypothetical protein